METNTSDATEITEAEATSAAPKPQLNEAELAQEALGHSNARTVSLLGLLLIGTGAALVLANFYSWGLASLGERLASYGITAGTLAVGGLILMGLGSLGNSFSRLAKRPRMTDFGTGDAINHMATEVKILTNSLSHLQEQVTALGMRDSTVHIDAPSPDQDLVNLYREQKESVYQLAAGLDKLGLQVTTQVTKDVSEIGDLFESLQARLNETQGEMSEELESKLSELAQSMRAVTPQFGEGIAEEETTLDQSSLNEFSDPPACEVSEAEGTNSIGEFDLASTTIAEFASIGNLMGPTNQVGEVSEPIEVQLEEPHADLEAEVSPLDFLEGLKSIEPESQNPHSPSVSTPPLDFDQLDEPSAALPRKQQPESEPTPNSWME